MKEITGYIRGYIYETDRRILFIITVFTGFLVWANYRFGIDDSISRDAGFLLPFLSRSGIFLLAFSIPYLIYTALAGKKYFREKGFVTLLLIAPLVFSFKVAFNPYFSFSDDWQTDHFWNYITYWPVLLLITTAALTLIRNRFDKGQPLYGIKTKNINWTPYIMMLLIMLPLVVAASTQPDFLEVYPKLISATATGNIDSLRWWQKLLFELSYGSDFITIELFFRGFLVIAFVKWAGKDAILPMACFYCTIHFGKPIGECISSYFGGMILGIVVYHTRSIYGGLMVHLGIAWMMEIGGYIGNFTPIP
ncbi:MAG: CPBP family intramembrane metalloprotease [Chitinophagaceae bacterium]|nr:CPBP family intramembrane metalloprotease [Chitinophagaceae bacterium]